jgi:hypothetical protein
MPTPPRDLSVTTNPFRSRNTLGPSLTAGVNGILEAVASSGHSHEQRLYAFSKALNNKKLTPYLHAAGLVPTKEVEGLKACQANAATITGRAREKAGHGGSINHDKKSLVESVALAFVDTPVNSPSHPNRTTQRSRGVTVATLQGAFGIPHSSAGRLYKLAREKHLALKERRDGTSWSRCKCLKAKKMLTNELVSELQHWVEKHPQVVQSPIVNDTLLIMNSQGLKSPVPKLLLRIPVRELHNDMIKSVEEGGFALARNNSGTVQISDTSLRDNLPPQL